MAELASMKDFDSCDHFDADCGVISICCSKLYQCQECHNADADHDLDKENMKVVCRFCFHGQKPTLICENCGEKLGKAYCKPCKIVFNNPEQFMHCSYCNACKYREILNGHCFNCGLCILCSSIVNHKCRVVGIDEECSICLSSLRKGLTRAFATSCGHKFHGHCFLKVLNNSGDLSCPICKTFYRFDECLFDNFNVIFGEEWTKVFEQNGYVFKKDINLATQIQPDYEDETILASLKNDVKKNIDKILEIRGHSIFYSPCLDHMWLDNAFEKRNPKRKLYQNGDIPDDSEQVEIPANGQTEIKENRINAENCHSPILARMLLNPNIYDNIEVRDNHQGEENDSKSDRVEANHVGAYRETSISERLELVNIDKAKANDESSKSHCNDSNNSSDSDGSGECSERGNNSNDRSENGEHDEEFNGES